MDGDFEPLRQKLRARGFVDVERNVYAPGFVYVLLDDRRQNCAELTFSSFRQGRWNVHINTLKFQEVERACRHSGWQLVRWIVGLAEDASIVYRITLEDEARMILIHRRTRFEVRIHLTRFRKFTEGVGWYEKFGFFPTDRDARLEYQRSYDSLRRASADSVSFLLWTIVRACLVHDARAEKVLTQGTLLKDRLYLSGTALEDDHFRHHAALVAAALQPLLPPEADDPASLLDRCGQVLEEVMERDQVCDALVEVLMRLGLSHSSRTRILGDKRERGWLQSHVRAATEKDACRCLVRALYPSNARTVQRILESDEVATGEVVDYLEVLHHFLEIMEMLGLLFTPVDLEYLPGNRPPSRPASPPECVRRTRACSPVTNERNFVHLVQRLLPRYSRPYCLPTLEDLNAGRLKRTMVPPSRIPV